MNCPIRYPLAIVPFLLMNKKWPDGNTGFLQSGANCLRHGKCAGSIAVNADRLRRQRDRFALDRRHPPGLQKTDKLSAASSSSFRTAPARERGTSLPFDR